MLRAPILNADQIIRTLLKAGFKIIRSKGIHFRFEHMMNKRRVTVSFHPGDISKKTFHSILDQAGLCVEEFLRHIR